jgi:DNA-binding YbaB/EbfC family protein
MGSGFMKMKKQRRQMEEQLQLLQDTLKNKSIEGQSGNGLVTITLSGNKTLTSIKIKPECVDPSDVEGLEDLILAAFQDAERKSEEDAPSLPGMPAGFSLPF